MSRLCCSNDGSSLYSLIEFSDLTAIDKAMKQHFDEDDAFKLTSRNNVAKLQVYDPPLTVIWHDQPCGVPEGVRRRPLESAVQVCCGTCSEVTSVPVYLFVCLLFRFYHHECVVRCCGSKCGCVFSSLFNHDSI